MGAPLLPPSARYLVLYDGVCGLCNFAVKFILPRDSSGIFAFAPLQSRLARELLLRNGIAPSIDSFRLVLAPFSSQERVLDKSQGALAILRLLDGPWRMLARLGALVPVSIADWIYWRVARNRYSIFGKYDACLMPSAATRPRFLALDEVHLDVPLDDPRDDGRAAA